MRQIFLTLMVATVLLASRAATADFRCGSGFSTYRVVALDGRAGEGVRCVLFTHQQYGNRFAWYGEGNWGGATYRHVGHAFHQWGMKLRGYAADIYGNGENARNRFDGNLEITMYGGGGSIDVVGGWRERWILVPSGAAPYDSTLGRVDHCGSHFQQYQVESLPPYRAGGGVRCVLRSSPYYVHAGTMTWYGAGEWGGTRYAHLGTFSSAGEGASDLCNEAGFCNRFDFASLHLTPMTGGGFHVTGAWNEMWRP